MNTVTILLVHHEDVAPKAVGSTWLFSGDGRESMRKGWEEANGWVKVAGPVDLQVAFEIREALTQFFKTSGVDVLQEAAAD